MAKSFCVFLTLATHPELLSEGNHVGPRVWETIIVIVEKDARFSARKGSCEVNGKTVSCAEGIAGGRVAGSIHAFIKLLQDHLDLGAMIPYRRREFEAETMVRELVRQVGARTSNLGCNPAAVET